MKDKSNLLRFMAVSVALLLGLLLPLGLLAGMALAQEPEKETRLSAQEGGISYWLILDTARPVEETLPPLLEILNTLKTSGAIVEFDPTPQRSAATAAAGVRVVIASSTEVNRLRTLPGVLDAVTVLPPPPPDKIGILATTGIITGQVTDAVSGLPLDGIPVSVYDAESFDWVGDDGTGWGGTPGEYSINGTAVYSKVKVVFNYPDWVDDEAYVREWYNDKPFFSEATPINLPDSGTVPNINAALARTGTISGLVTLDGGGPAENVSVDVFTPNWHWVGDGTTNAEGLFTARVPAGTYKLQLFGWNYVLEWYRDKDSIESADSVVVTTGATTTLTAQVARAGVITGVVTNASNGAFLESVEVTAYDADGEEWSSSWSDSQGEYTVTGLPPGSYRLRFRHYLLSYEIEYYNDKSTLAAADPVTVQSGVTSRVDAALTPATGHIAGTITKNGGTPLAAGEDVWLELYNAATGDYLTYFNFNGDGATTTYDFTVAAGTYKVAFFPDPDNLGYEWYNNKTSRSTADPVTVTAGATTSNINADLAVTAGTGCISGTVTTGGSTPLEDAQVKVYEVGEDWDYDNTSSDPDGGYLICYVDPGDYQVSFSYFPSATTWYNGKTSRATATTVTVSAGATRTDVNGSLDQLGGCIAGKVVGLDGQALSWTEFQVFEAGGGSIPFYEGLYGTDLEDWGEADDDGGFVACGLQPGAYTIAFYGWDTQDNELEGSITANVTTGQTTNVGTVKIGLPVYLPLIRKN